MSIIVVTEIPVYLPHKQGSLMAKVSTEDYDKVIQVSTRWRRSSSGYPIAVKRENGKVQTTYLHKVIFGDTARHVNGDRLDNTRENLVPSSRGQKRKRTVVEVKIDPDSVNV